VDEIITPFGINGLGRIGRLVVRNLATEKPSRLVAVNDPADLETIVHLLRYDSVHVHNHLHIDGYSREKQDYLVIENHEMPLFHEKNPRFIPWTDYKVSIVIEASGKFINREGASKHLGGTVKKVLISAPSPDPDCTIILPIQESMNLDSYAIISNASCTAHATAPMLSVIENYFGIESCTMSTVHVATNDQRLQDAPHYDLRRARAAMVGIHPTTSSAFNTLKQALPWVHRDMNGWALRVPTLSVNLVDLTFILKISTTIEAIHDAFKSASLGELKGIIGITESPMVSCDFTGREESVIMDLTLTKLIDGKFLKIFGWHDNEVAYATRLCELAIQLS